MTKPAFTHVDDVIAENEHAILFPSLYPVTDGHLLIIFRDNTVTWWNATSEQRTAVLDLLDYAKAHTDAPDCNVGWNDGTAAGQTVMQYHLHFIPRRPGDCDDPTGGVRNVIPAKGNYLR